MIGAYRGTARVPYAIGRRRFAEKQIFWGSLHCATTKLNGKERLEMAKNFSFFLQNDGWSLPTRE